ncbi:hypothetical protein [Gordonia caeni]|uniref:hypothetical protein n=1 Tax=Gordonia caeni TaxID=1007097 RepID=UPI0031D16DC5
MTAAPLPRSRPPVPNRRAVLRGGAGLTLAVAAGSAVAACTSGPSDRQLAAESLVPLAQSAARQEQQAQQLAPRETAYTAALQQVATERGEHAQALVDEINRLHSPAAAQASTAPGGTDPVTLDVLRAELETAARLAAAGAVDADGFRAGLLGSISASCATLREVQLA